MKSEITKHLITDENMKFDIGNDIHFYLNRNDKTYSCFGIITDIDASSFKIFDVEIDKMHVSDELTIKFSEVKDGVIHYTENGWC